jgi:protein pelota
MKILFLDKKTKIIKFVPQTIEDLWTIKNICSSKDIISGRSYRRQRQDLSNDSVRKPVYVTIEIEKLDFSSELDSLRFTGIIIDSKPKEFAPLGEHHTLEIEFNNSYTIKKKEIFDYEINLLNNSSKISENIIVIVIDNEQANIFRLNNIENKILAKIESNRSGKRYSTNYKEIDFFLEIYNVIEELNNQIIIAGPGKIKSRFREFLKTKNTDLKILEINLHNVSDSSINELFSKKEVSKFFTNSIIYKENNLINLFLENLGKNNNKSVYGLNEIQKIIELGALENILISENLWKKDLDNIQELIRKSEKLKTNVHIVDSDHKNISKTLNSFGGIIGILRFKI